MNRPFRGLADPDGRNTIFSDIEGPELPAKASILNSPVNSARSWNKKQGNVMFSCVKFRSRAGLCSNTLGHRSLEWDTSPGPQVVEWEFTLERGFKLVCRSGKHHAPTGISAGRTYKHAGLRVHPRALFTTCVLQPAWGSASTRSAAAAARCPLPWTRGLRIRMLWRDLQAKLGRRRAPGALRHSLQLQWF